MIDFFPQGCRVHIAGLHLKVYCCGRILHYSAFVAHRDSLSSLSALLSFCNIVVLFHVLFIVILFPCILFCSTAVIMFISSFVRRLLSKYANIYNNSAVSKVITLAMKENDAICRVWFSFKLLVAFFHYWRACIWCYPCRFSAFVVSTGWFSFLSVHAACCISLMRHYLND